MARFRAIENRRSLVRVANSGISGFVDPAGRVVKKINLFDEGCITQGVSLNKNMTFYTNFGDVFAILCIAISFLTLCFLSFQKTRIHLGE